MAGRSKPNWAVFVGGPLDGKRQLLHPDQGEGLVMIYTDPVTGPTRMPHEYMVTNERRPGGFHESVARVAVFVRSLPEEPQPGPFVRHGPSQGPN